MNDDLYQEQLQLEEEARGLSIRRFHKEHLEGTKGNTFSETFVGTFLVKSYLKPFAEAIDLWLTESNTGKAGRKATAAKLLDGIDPWLVSFLMLKAIFNNLGTYSQNKPVSFTALAMAGADMIHDELRLREFDKEFRRLSQKIHKDFDKRELPRVKREEYMQGAFAKVGLDWSIWSRADKVHVGTALLDIFKHTTGDIEVTTTGSGAAKRDVVLASDGLRQMVERNVDHCEALFTVYMPTVIPPRDWSADTLESGGYFSLEVNPYPLVKRSKKGYRELLKHLVEDGKLDRVLTAINGLQRTAWKVNTRVLDAIEHVYSLNIPCGKLPQSDVRKPDPAPRSLEGLPPDHEDVLEYRAYCFKVHEANRRSIGKRVMAGRSFQVARKFSSYTAIYFPHDLDSRGRAYPKPSGLNPQGPDYVKGLLQFAQGKPLGERGVYWLGVHGANSAGHDKLELADRYKWAMDNRQLAKDIARDPLLNLEWTKTDNPCQFLAWCFEWAEVWDGKVRPEAYVSYLHVDLDATCSGLQHFSAMLRDAVGGFHVNMTPNKVRQDVYGAVAKTAIGLIQADLGGEKDMLAKAWLEFGLDRSVTKRPVMVKPYSGTRSSCNGYVSDAVDEKLDKGFPMPVPKDNIWELKMYGSGKVWEAIPHIVVAADGAMKWLMSMSRLVGKSQPESRRIEWVTPLGFPVHQYKFNTESYQIKTFFDGKIMRPRVNRELDSLDPRAMASSVPPSFVHSLDACHLMATISGAMAKGMNAFAVVHDSFGVHAADVQLFTEVIRDEFITMYEEHDVLSEFYESVRPFIKDEYQDDIPVLPMRGTLDLQGIKQNEFFFS